MPSIRVSAPNILYCEMSLSILPLPTANHKAYANLLINTGNLVIFGKHVMVEPYMGDTRFDRGILLDHNSPHALEWPSLLRGWGISDLLHARLRQSCLSLAIRSGSSSAAMFLPSCNSSTWSSRSTKQQVLLAKPRPLTRPMLSWSHVGA